MVVLVYVNHAQGEALSEKQFAEKIHNMVAEILCDDSDGSEKDSYLNDYLEMEGYDYADCFQMSESRRQDIRTSFREWLYEDVKDHLLETHFDEYEVEI